MHMKKLDHLNHLLLHVACWSTACRPVSRSMLQLLNNDPLYSLTDCIAYDIHITRSPQFSSSSDYQMMSLSNRNPINMITPRTIISIDHFSTNDTEEKLASYLFFIVQRRHNRRINAPIGTWCNLSYHTVYLIDVDARGKRAQACSLFALSSILQNQYKKQFNTITLRLAVP